MSTLTKVLIILLCIFSFFLCGIVVTYISSATNYKDAFEKQRTNQQALKAKVNALNEQLDKKTGQIKNLQNTSSNKISSLEKGKITVEVELRNAQRENIAYQERINSWAGVVKGLNQTISDIETSLNLTRAELDNIRIEQIKDRKSIDEITTALNEKMAQINAIETERRRLLEQKIGFENKLKQAGVLADIKPVTPTKTSVKPVGIVPSVSLNGLVKAVDINNSLVSISLGSADGVMKGMKFFVMRGDTFICEVTITDVDTEESAGIMDLVQQLPQAGDSLSTEL